MKVGIVSDLHCNLQGLDLALEAMGDVDELLCLGDSIFEYRFSNCVVARLKERGAHIIQGNHEEVFLSPAGVRARERKDIDPDMLAFLASQPHRRYLELDGKRLLLIHSTPWEPRGEYVHPHSAKLDLFAEADANIVLYGHTHCQVVKRVGSVLVINPGSAGDARDSRNGRQLSCAVLDTVSEEVQVIDFPDPRFVLGRISPRVFGLNALITLAGPPRRGIRAGRTVVVAPSGCEPVRYRHGHPLSRQA